MIFLLRERKFVIFVTKFEEQLAAINPNFLFHPDFKLNFRDTYCFVNPLLLIIYLSVYLKNSDSHINSIVDPFRLDSQANFCKLCQRLKTAEWIKSCWLVPVSSRVQERLPVVLVGSHDGEPEFLLQHPQRLRPATPRHQRDVGRVRKGYITAAFAGEITAPETRPASRSGRQSNVNPNQLKDITNSSAAITRPLSQQSSDYSDLTSSQPDIASRLRKIPL